jgi:hypothetical protein
MGRLDFLKETAMTQMRFESMRELRPPRPTVHDEAIAEEIATHIVEAVNLDEFYWEGDDITDLIAIVRDDIILHGEPEKVFLRIASKEPPEDCKGTKSQRCHMYETISQHCVHITGAIVAEVLEAAEKRYDERYN